MRSSGEENAKTYVIYKNKTTGEVKEYLSPEYPWNDTVWLKEWEFVDQRFDDSGVIRNHNVFIEDSEGDDFTKHIIENPDAAEIITKKAKKVALTKYSSSRMAMDYFKLYGYILQKASFLL